MSPVRRSAPPPDAAVWYPSLWNDEKDVSATTIGSGTGAQHDAQQRERLLDVTHPLARVAEAEAKADDALACALVADAPAELLWTGMDPVELTAGPVALCSTRGQRKWRSVARSTARAYWPTKLPFAWIYVRLGVVRRC